MCGIIEKVYNNEVIISVCLILSIVSIVDVFGLSEKIYAITGDVDDCIGNVYLMIALMFTTFVFLYIPMILFWIYLRVEYYQLKKEKGRPNGKSK